MADAGISSCIKSRSTFTLALADGVHAFVYMRMAWDWDRR